MLDGGKTRISSSTMPQVGRAVALLSLKILPDDKDDNSPCLVDFKTRLYTYPPSLPASKKDMLESVLRVTNTKLDDWKITQTTVERYWKSGLELSKTGNVSGFI